MSWLECEKIINNIENCGDKLVIKSNFLEVIEVIKNNYHFDMLKQIIAVDKQEHGIELIYHLYNIEDEENLYLSIITRGEVESVSKFFDSATADEKEIYDLFGIKFIGNEELKRLYMPESWDGNPLRKDYTEKDERLNWNDDSKA